MFERQREADAALFEDWTPWTGLVYTMPEWGVFELRPRSARAETLAGRIPGIARSRRHGHLVRDDRMPPWHLPLERWRDLRAALPNIKAADDADRAVRTAEEAAQEARREGERRDAAAARMAALLKPPEDRTPGERVEAVITAYLMRDRRLTAWEREFAVDLGNRWHRFGDKFSLTERQRAVVERIHDKVRDTVIL